MGLCERIWEKKSIVVGSHTFCHGDSHMKRRCNDTGLTLEDFSVLQSLYISHCIYSTCLEVNRKREMVVENRVDL